MTSNLPANMPKRSCSGMALRVLRVWAALAVTVTLASASLAGTSPGGESGGAPVGEDAGPGVRAAAPATVPSTSAMTPMAPKDLGGLRLPQQDLERRLQQLQEQRRLCARCDCFALRADKNATVRVPLDENLDDASGNATGTTSDAKAATRATTAIPPGENKVLAINCTGRVPAEELPRWSWPARLSLGETVGAETWAEFRGGDLSGVARLPALPFRLTRLSLAGNRLRAVAPRAFANLAALADLDLSHNLIADVPHDAFVGLPSLRRLDLSHNGLGVRSLPADLLRDLDQLAVVSLAHNKLAGDLNEGTLPWSDSLQELDLSHNELVGVSAGAWGRLPSVKTLDLSHNKLHSLTPDALAGLRALQRLDLSWNALDALPPTAFAGLDALERLDLSHNALRRLPDAALFAPLRSLASLDLSWNDLGPDSLPALSALPASLRALDASRNPLGRADGGLEAQRDAAATLPAGLESLSLERCGLHGLDARAWGGLRALRRLQVAGNAISAFADLATMSAMRELNASRNGLTRFPGVALPALRALDVSHNQLERAPAVDAPRLAALLLDGNPLEELRVDATTSLALLSASRMPLLRSVRAVRLAPRAPRRPDEDGDGDATCLALLLDHNPALREVREDALRGVRLCRLDLSHGALDSLPATLTDWGSVPALDLQGNPWDCSCGLQWMLDSVVPQLYRSDPTLLDDLRCAGPAQVTGRRLVHWFNHSGRALCEPSADTRAAGMSVTFKMPVATVAVVASAALVAVGLLLLGVLTHRQYVARRRARNRRL